MDQFLVNFVHKCCLSLIAEKINQRAAELLKLIFDMVGSPETVNNYRATEAFTLSSLRSRVVSHETLSTLPLDDYLAEMCNDSYAFLKKKDDNAGGCYVISTLSLSLSKKKKKKKKKTSYSLGVDIDGVLNIIWQRLVESVILERYGAVSKRIFRLLLSKKFLDQKQLAQLAMIPADQAREKLYRMMSDGITNIQEVPKSSDRLVVRTFFLWFVNYPQVLKTTQDNSLKMMANLRARYNRELSLSEKLIEKTNAINNGEGGGLTKSEELQLETLQDTLSQLENAQNHLLESIILFQFV